MSSIGPSQGNAIAGGAPTRTPADAHDIAPGDIAIGVVIGRASEYFDYFV